jgi:hypothetical protein
MGQLVTQEAVSGYDCIHARICALKGLSQRDALLLLYTKLSCYATPLPQLVHLAFSRLTTW